jgi:hypothetical protein
MQVFRRVGGMVGGQSICPEIADGAHTGAHTEFPVLRLGQEGTSPVTTSPFITGRYWEANVP